jgi:hypothetical protein
MKEKSKNPFRNYKQAIRFLKMYVHSQTLLSNYNPTEIDWALFTIFKSKKEKKNDNPQSLS